MMTVVMGRSPSVQAHTKKKIEQINQVNCQPSVSLCVRSHTRYGSAVNCWRVIYQKVLVFVWPIDDVNDDDDDDSDNDGTALRLYLHRVKHSNYIP